MRFSELFGPTAAELAVTALLTVSSLPQTRAVDFKPVPPPNLDLSKNGRVALTGDFDSISLYTYEGQNQNGFTTNGSQALLQQLPNGVFATLKLSDAMIMDMCPYIRKDGTLAGVVVGGNFTSLGGVAAQGIALLDYSQNKVTQLEGLNGSVNAVFCDQERDTVFVGGDFSVKGEPTNAINWVGMAGWTTTPFAGFNGPVYSINKNSEGNIVFGGSFTGLGNNTTPSNVGPQIVNLQTANISSSSGGKDGFNDPKSVICSDGQDGPGKTWLTADGGGGFWRADFNFGFEPFKLRIYNTHQDGRGTRTFRFTAFPINGIMNLTYTDPKTKQNTTCDNNCPLSNDTSLEFQDFTFVNNVGMNSFQIDIRDWYGDGGGFNGIELFQNDTYAYAVSDLNEPSCANINFASNSTQTGPWKVTPSGNSAAQYLTADLSGADAADRNSTEVTFLPDIKQDGNYSVTIYTPGCQADNTCQNRGRANVTGFFHAGDQPSNNIIFQTNDFDKYDLLYTGPVDASTSDFRPRITLTAEGDTSTVVALRVRFQLLDPSSSGLNGLFEYDPDKATMATDFAENKIVSAGTSLKTGADIYSLAVIDKTTYVGGNFENDNISNIFALPDNANATTLTAGGLNNAVAPPHPFGNQLYVGGNFTDTTDSSTADIKHVALYDVDSQKWSPLGGGVNGPVLNIVPLQLNITSGTPETCITVNGPFTQVLQSGNKKSFNVSGFAIWVPSHDDWLQNLDIQAQKIEGQLTAATNITNDTPILAGTIQSQGYALSDAVALSTNNGNTNLAPIGLQEPPSPASSDSTSRLAKRQSASASPSVSNNINGAITGLFVTDNDRNITILGGRFEAIADDNTDIFNVAFINTDKNGKQSITGLNDGIDQYSAVRSISRKDNTVSFGGNLTGKLGGDDIAGLVQWDLGSNDFLPTQPPGLQGGDDVVVYATANKPDSNDLYVGGSFTSAGQTQCPAVCVWSDGSWIRPGQGVDGTVSTLLWQGKDKLLVAGNMTISGNATFLGLYEVDNNQAWSVPDGANAIPGPVTALRQTEDDGSQFWVSGNAADGSAYLIKFDGKTFKPVPDLFGNSTTIRGLSVLSTAKDHDDNDFLDNDLVLMITGTISINGFGNASAVLFNGTTLTPLILANAGNNQGSLSQVITEMEQKFNSGTGHMKLGYVVAIALAIALGVMALLVAAGLLIERRRKKAEGYRPAPQNYFEKTANMGRIPPERLFQSLNQPQSAPRV